MDQIGNYSEMSYWERVTFFEGIDVAIIGSGIVGLSAAIHLKELAPKLNVAVLDRGTLPLGASTKNAGFACFGSLTELIADLDVHTESEVFDLVEKRWRGLQRLRERIGDKQLKYEEHGGFELFKTDEDATFQNCREQIGYFNEKLLKITGRKQTYSVADEMIRPFGFQGVSHLILNRSEGQLHTGAMMKALINLAAEKNIRFFSGMEAEGFEEAGNGVRLFFKSGWEINVSRLVVATNGFARQLIPELDVRPARNQVLITKPVEGLPFRGCFHYEKGYYYFRNIDGRVLLGGGRNLALQAESTSEFGTTPLIRDALQRLLKEVILPGKTFEVDGWWSGILGVGDSKATIIKKHSDCVFIAVRMGGMGVAIGSLVGEEVAKMVVEN